LRREIEAACLFRRNIIPVLLEGFDFNATAIANQLTGSLALLRRFNALRVHPEYFEEAMSRLCGRFLHVS
jgi:hypothetical protein